MSAIDRIFYQARVLEDGTAIAQSDTSITDPREASSWRRRLESWLKTGRPGGNAYLDFGSEAAFIRWWGDPGFPLAWKSALVLVGESGVLTPIHALELPSFAAPGAALGSSGTSEAGQWRGGGVMDMRARSADAIAALTPLLAHVLRGERRVTMPWAGPGLADAVMWGFFSIAAMLGDERPASFLANGTAPSQERDHPGLLVTFRPDATVPLPPDQGFVALAADLAGRFAEDPDELRRTLAEHGLPAAADHNSRITRLLNLPPRSKSGNDHQGGTANMTTMSGNWAPAEPDLICPICLGDIPDWAGLDPWRWDDSEGDGDYVKIVIPENANRVKRNQLTHGAHVRCPHSTDESAHYLPASYGRFGNPLLLGFVGVTKSGKTHLLASMIASISRLADYGLSVKPLDTVIHQGFSDRSVRPLIADNEVLPGTPDDATTMLADAFLVQDASGSERVVALFDVSGGDLTKTGDKTKEFLWLTQGLFFVVDPEHIQASKAGDATFRAVLDIVEQRGEPGQVSAAIVLNKADKARFEEPVDRWLRAGDGTLDPVEFLRESADVYTYLEGKAPVLTEPYRACDKATLHVASPTGGPGEESEGGKYPRGVTPLRVLRPLVAMLAMTGVITGRQAEAIGI
ncbi:MAG: hypothetical protein JWM19_3254 [Actinomycetia bacterium]|nr:hypothetical protein [Actinomycetes bacterium]